MQQLTLNETRVVGCLIEKSITTPDQYPLSLNSLTTACNQKSNRDPVLNLSESEVQAALDELEKKNLIAEVRFGGRVAKYQHRFYATEFSEFRFTPKERALICLLFLRGSQTPGELRSRTNRLAEFDDIQDVETTLDTLATHAYGPFVKKLEREPGKREARYQHLFCGEPDEITAPPSTTLHEQSENVMPISSNANELEERVELLEAEVDELRSELNAIKRAVNELGNQSAN